MAIIRGEGGGGCCNNSAVQLMESNCFHILDQKINNVTHSCMGLSQKQVYTLLCSFSRSSEYRTQVTVSKPSVTVCGVQSVCFITARASRLTHLKCQMVRAFFPWIWYRQFDGLSAGASISQLNAGWLVHCIWMCADWWKAVLGWLSRWHQACPAGIFLSQQCVVSAHAGAVCIWIRVVQYV